MENGWETCYVGKELLKALTIVRNVRVLGYLCREQGCAIHNFGTLLESHMQFIRMGYTTYFNSASFLKPLFCCLKVFDGVKVDTNSGLQGLLHICAFDRNNRQQIRRLEVIW